MIRYFLSFLIISIPLMGFTPGKWSHKDKILFQPGNFGPSKEIVRNAEGQVIYVATYEYDDNGRLLSETYQDKEGHADGRTVFRYTEGLLSLEEVYDQTAILTERKEFHYRGKFLKKIITKDATGRVLISYNIETDPFGYVIAGEGKTNDTKDVENFRFHLDPNRSNVQIQKVTDGKQKNLGEIYFTFDSKGNLIEREFRQGNQLKIHKLRYRTDGRLDSFSFHVKQGDNWILEKTHILVYDEKGNDRLSKRN